MISRPARLLPSLCIALAAAAVTPCASADTLGLRITPRTYAYALDANDDDNPARLRINISLLDSAISAPAFIPANTLRHDSGSNSSMRSNAAWADWYPFGSGLRTSLGLAWRDTANRSENGAIDSDYSFRSQAFLGLGWSSRAASSAPGWRISADLGASIRTQGDCGAMAISCATPAGFGLKFKSGGDGIRWNPFISIGASYQY